MINIAICDDDEKLCFYIENILINCINEQIETDVFFSGEELYQELSCGKIYDVIYLDIELKELSGIELGLKIRSELHNNFVEIIYISSHSEYALQLFQIRPYDFLLKPLHQKNLIKSAEKVIEFSGNYAKIFEYRKNHNVYKIPYNKILFFESHDREVIVHTTDGNKDAFYAKIKDIARNLSESFILSHRSYLVNHTKVQAVFKDKIKMENGKIIPISRARKNEMRIFFNKEKDS